MANGLILFAMVASIAQISISLPSKNTKIHTNFVKLRSIEETTHSKFETGLNDIFLSILKLRESTCGNRNTRIETSRVIASLKSGYDGLRREVETLSSGEAVISKTVREAAHSGIEKMVELLYDALSFAKESPNSNQTLAGLETIRKEVVSIGTSIANPVFDRILNVSSTQEDVVRAIEYIRQYVIVDINDISDYFMRATRVLVEHDCADVRGPNSTEIGQVTTHQYWAVGYLRDLVALVGDLVRTLLVVSVKTETDLPAVFNTLMDGYVDYGYGLLAAHDVIFQTIGNLTLKSQNLVEWNSSTTESMRLKAHDYFGRTQTGVALALSTIKSSDGSENTTVHNEITDVVDFIWLAIGLAENSKNYSATLSEIRTINDEVDSMLASFNAAIFERMARAWSNEVEIVREIENAHSITDHELKMVFAEFFTGIEILLAEATGTSDIPIGESIAKMKFAQGKAIAINADDSLVKFELLRNLGIFKALLTDKIEFSIIDDPFVMRGYDFSIWS